MTERGLYYATEDFYQFVRDAGGEWNDTKHRPVICLVKSSENPELYWAIPMGNYKHRTEEQQQRIEHFINMPAARIESCYYHVGRTTNKSIFFISDAIPITEQYIAEPHTDINGVPFEIKNPKLIAELERKLFRILAVENSDNNHFRQHITDVKRALLLSLAEKNNTFLQNYKTK